MRPEALHLTAYTKWPWIKVDLLESHFLICKMKKFPKIFLCSKILELPKVTWLVSDKSLPGAHVSWWNVLFTKVNCLTRQGRRRKQQKHPEADICILWHLLMSRAGRENQERGRPKSPRSHMCVGLSCSYLSICWEATCLGADFLKMGSQKIWVCLLPPIEDGSPTPKRWIHLGRDVALLFLFPVLVLFCFALL